MSELAKRLEKSDDNGDDESDDRYFGSYGSLNVHRVMVSDYLRTDAFRRAILGSTKMLRKKDVLEIGCGTGILSIFACQAGAKRVYAVEASDSIWYAKRVIAKNGYKNKIQLVQSKIEDFVMPSGKKVDAIISEWMGYTLLREWMLPSVISTRDRLLKKGGLMFPNKVTMSMALVCETSYLKDRVEFWRNGPMKEYKVNMDALAEEEYTAIIGGEMPVHQVNPSEIVSSSCDLFSLDLHTITLEECSQLSAKFSLKAFQDSEIFGVCLWFKAFFPADVDLNTSPFFEPTHWMQTVLYVPPFPVKQNDVISGTVTFRRGRNKKRNLSVGLNFENIKSEEGLQKNDGWMFFE